LGSHIEFLTPEETAKAYLQQYFSAMTATSGADLPVTCRMKKSSGAARTPEACTHVRMKRRWWRRSINRQQCLVIEMWLECNRRGDNEPWPPLV
jgi:hypothetical protein